MIHGRRMLWRLTLSFIWLPILALGCAAQQQTVPTRGGVPSDTLTRYNDSFDRFRADLWDRAGYVEEAHLADYEQADVRIEGGRLLIKTRTGCFSKGGLGSKYGLRGDFDVQIDCRMDFQPGLKGMDQVLLFLALEKGAAVEAVKGVSIGLGMRPGKSRGFVFCGYIEEKTFHRTYAKQTGDFDGTLRIVRIDDEATAFFCKGNEDGWKKMSTVPFSATDVMVGFKLRNFVKQRSVITAPSSVAAQFDNFRINAAEEIIEPEI